ncbi:Rieske (2Fe-2S) protein [Pseudomonas sp. PDM16]|uniref:Rieske (2Fe-2S) protein n=1 Tax=Pseudomonas sp. PDM16 TaxID=2769292 RepID=UPI001783D896|nr:Rieske (2Fe-2S) protein [Pseudomonas sp. PDM16]MBD9415376.1 Rieske (2Fe-2S) protein [Pseudomonas sp. PDM16]
MIRLCAPQELTEGCSRGFSIQNRRLLAVRRDGRPYVYLNHCPHRGLALEWREDDFLDDSGSLLRCAHHGALFLIESGECVAGPCSGQSLRALPCREDADGLWAELPLR